jgi:hypothetical protein
MSREEEIADLKRKLKVRKGRPGSEENVKAIEEEIARMETGNAD